MFGPATPSAGMRAGTYYQVTLDPAMASPSGEFIYFDQSKPELANDIHGWQRIAALTVCEILGYYDENGQYPAAAPGVDESQLRMMVVKNELQPAGAG